MAACAPPIGQQLLLSSRLASLPPSRARFGAYIPFRPAISSSIGTRSRLASFPAAAAIEYLDDAGVGFQGSASFAAPEGLESAAQEDMASCPAKGSVGVVEAMTGKTIDLNSGEVIDAGIGGDGNIGQSGGGGGGGGNGGEGDDSSSGQRKQSGALSMSQKLTLVYAAIVGVGGLIGFLKSGSVKSLFSGGLFALSLLTVYSQLPVNPVGASSLGVGISLLLLLVMGSRFRNSGKFFPAGLVSIVSLIMSAGYAHGILRSKH